MKRCRLFSILWVAVFVGGTATWNGCAGKLKVDPSIGLIEPIGEVTNRHPTFVWREDYKADFYELVVARDEYLRYPVMRKGNLRTTEYKLEVPLEPDSEYYWSVIAYTRRKDDKGRRAESVRFLLKFGIPDLIYPEDDSVVTSLSPTLRWRNVEDAMGYEVQVSQASGFPRSDLVFAGDNIVPSVVRLPGDDGRLNTKDDVEEALFRSEAISLQSEQGYYWRARANFGGGESVTAKGDWSKTYAFRVPSQPGGESLANSTLIASGGKIYHPALSPDGRVVAFAMEDSSGTAEIWSAELYGAGKTKITKSIAGSKDTFPSWIQDGEAIVFTSNRAGGKDGIWKTRIGSIGLTTVLGDATKGQFSPDGTKLLYTRRSASGDTYIWVNNTQLTVGEDPTWSPDGMSILYAKKTQRGNYEIWTVNTTTGENKLVVSYPNVDSRWPRWSPDGRRIAFQSNKAGNFDVWVVNLDTGEEQQLTNYLGFDGEPVWMPDSKNVIFVSTRQTNKMNLWMGAIP